MGFLKENSSWHLIHCNKMKMRLQVFLSLLIAVFSTALPSALSAQDLNGPLTLDQYFDLVLANHPIVRQTSLLNATADAYELKARGGFDPKLKGSFDHKSYDNKDYFTIGEVAVEVPTWYGLEVKAGFNWTEGIFLNPENNLPAAGQAQIGLTANLLQGLMIDKRRADLQQAQIMQNRNEAERRALVNEILLSANEAYWDWVAANNIVGVYEEVYQLAIVRFDGLRESYIQGYKAAVDTLESQIQVQNRLAQLQDARLKVVETRLKLSNYLWSRDNIPLELSPQVPAPELDIMPVLSISNDSLRQLLGMVPEQHPLLQEMGFKLDQLAVQERLNREMLKPQLQVNYNLLADGFNFNAYQNGDNQAFRNILSENYKWGASLKFPLFLRKQRADLSLTRIKVQETYLKVDQKRLELQNKVNNYVNNVNTLDQQIDQYAAMVQNYRDLLTAENEKFRLGSSSLFLLNSREQKLIETQEKLIKAQAKFQKSNIAVMGASGTLVDYR
ncbi:MAG: TolC family protein [Saprospiraceae bacterium]